MRKLTRLHFSAALFALIFGQAHGAPEDLAPLSSEQDGGGQKIELVVSYVHQVDPTVTDSLEGGEPFLTQIPRTMSVSGSQKIAVKGKLSLDVQDGTKIECGFEAKPGDKIAAREKCASKRAGSSGFSEYDNFSQRLVVRKAELQLDLAGLKLVKGQKIEIAISLPILGIQIEDKRKTKVPQLVKQSRSAALEALRSAHLVIGFSKEEESPLPQGLVLSQDPAAGAEVEEGSGVNLILSGGLKEIPAVAKQNVAEAFEQIHKLGYRAAIGKFVWGSGKRGIIVEQKPRAGIRAKVGTTVELTVSLGATPSTGILNDRDKDRDGVRDSLTKKIGELVEGPLARVFLLDLQRLLAITLQEKQKEERLVAGHLYTMLGDCSELVLGSASDQIRDQVLKANVNTDHRMRLYLASDALFGAEAAAIPLSGDLNLRCKSYMDKLAEKK